MAIVLRSQAIGGGNLQNSFFERVADLGMILELIEDIPGVCLSIKDHAGRFVYLCSGMQLLLGMDRPDDIIGSTDLDHFPAAIADRFIKGDAEVMESGHPLRNIREPFLCPIEGFTWSITSKWPLRNRDGEIIGVLGIYRTNDSTKPLNNHSVVNSLFGEIKHHEEIHRTTEFIIENSHRTLTSEEIARNVGVSTRQLTRILHDTHLLSPRNFATMIRIQMASKSLVETDLPIIDIAHSHGFANQSSFTTQFKKFSGTTPRQYRYGARQSRENARKLNAKESGDGFFQKLNA